MNDLNEMFRLLENNELMYVECYTILSTGWNTIFTIHYNDSSVLEYLNNNKFPVVYSDMDDCIILVKF